MKWKNILATSLVFYVFIFGCSTGTKRQNISSIKASHKEVNYGRANELVQSMARLIDQRQWYQLEQVFAWRTILNYGVPEILTPTQIVDRWKPVISYFDKTDMDITNFKYTETQGRLLGSANYTATYKKETTVTVNGIFEYEFFRGDDGELKIMRLTESLGSTKGDEKLLELAKSIDSSKKLNYTVEKVDFYSKGNKLIGWLLKPKKRSIEDVVIIGGNWTSVKEQISYPYAQNLVEKGFPVLVFDFTGYGESEGKIRNIEDPGQKIIDIHEAVNYLTNRREYEQSKVTLIGVGASAGYMGAEAARDPRIGRLVMIAPRLHDAEIIENELEQAAGHEKRGYNGRMQAATSAYKKYYEKDVVDYIPVASFTDEQAATFTMEPYLIDYYLNPDRGNIPQWKNELAVMSWKPWLTFNAMESAPLIKVPTLIIHSKEAALPQSVKKYISMMKVAPEVVWTKGFQYDFYDKKNQIEKVVNLTIGFLNKEEGIKPTKQAQEAKQDL